MVIERRLYIILSLVDHVSGERANFLTGTCQADVSLAGRTLQQVIHLLRTIYRMNDNLVRDGVREDHVLFGRRDERRDWPGDASVPFRVLKNRQSQTKRALGGSTF